METKYTIDTLSIAGRHQQYQSDLSLSEVLIAAPLAARQGTHQVYVSWYRSSDGQTGYLDRDGNHTPVGHAW